MHEIDLKEWIGFHKLWVWNTAKFQHEKKMKLRKSEAFLFPTIQKKIEESMKKSK